MKNKVFITTAIDYANDVVHVGHAYEKVLADAVARYERLKKDDAHVYLTIGTDEHGTTNEKAAQRRGLTPLEHVTEISKADQEQIDTLNISYQRFIRTTDEDHVKFSSEFFKKSFEAGDIYKASYKGYYCEGCESTKTLSELDENKQCPNHKNRQIQELDEENYFFKLSKYSDFLKELIETDKLLVRPLSKRTEMLAFIEQGLKDVTVTRPKYKVSWGITAPNDSEQVIYVWFDALINYLTEGLAKGFWDDKTEITHFVGKDISRWHALLWPAMLKSAGYRLPDKIYIHGFINLGGQKISKSLGNVIRPKELVETYGVDAVRYYLLRNGPIVEDADLSIQQLEEVYNGELASGLGNTVARLAKLAERSKLDFKFANLFEIDDELFKPIEDFRVDKVLSNIFKTLADLDKNINEKEPWKIEDREELRAVLTEQINSLKNIAFQLQPFIPNAAETILKVFESGKVKSPESMFPRL